MRDRIKAFGRWYWFHVKRAVRAIPHDDDRPLKEQLQSDVLKIWSFVLVLLVIHAVEIALILLVVLLQLIYDFFAYEMGY